MQTSSCDADKDWMNWKGVVVLWAFGGVLHYLNTHGLKFENLMDMLFNK